MKLQIAANRAARTLCGSFLLASTLLAHSLPAQTVSIDASAPAQPPQPVLARGGTARNPQGEILGANSQYLTRNGKPWIPVMGEFHFSRYPESQWEQEILKMKSAGVNIVATYIIWIHHEQQPGQWNWTGQRNLRHFTELCAKHGVYVYPRIGPWAHAEVRNGGLPDWVLKAGPTRQNDPVYLKEVDAFFNQISAQLKGLLWKDGGPVIGLQVENEFNKHGAGQGAEHIRTLKKMAIADGLDVPLYTVTGWDGAVIPLDETLPVFGGYPDAPWDGSNKKLPANEVFAFRFDNRSAGSMGAIGGHNQSAASTYRGTPFLTAEVGDGTEDTYFRRPVIATDEVAVIPTVMLGSGANLLGYYMFHGGRNPEGGDITLQESQLTGYPTDVPVKSYDFQAPLGEFGQVRPTLNKLKLVHYFLADFGSLLAPMQPHAPAQVPTNPTDASVPRVSARTNGDSGFVFLSNEVRSLDMPARQNFQVQLKLPSGSLSVPATPITLPTGAYGIWPVNLQLNGTLLRYATAQLFKRVESAGQTYFFFFTIPGVSPEFCFEGTPAVTSIQTTHDAAGTHVFAPLAASADFKLPNSTHIVLLPQAEAERVWRTDDPHLLVSTPATFFADGPTWTLQSLGDPNLQLAVFGSNATPAASVKIIADRTPGLFRHFQAALPPVTLQPVVTPVAEATPRGAVKFGPVLAWRKNPVPLAPDDADFAHAARWTIQLPPLPPALHDAFLTIRYRGDVARLSRANELLDDNFWNGIPWSLSVRTVGLGGTPSSGASYELKILPLAPAADVYLEGEPIPKPGEATLQGVAVVPEYQLVLQAPVSPK